MKQYLLSVYDNGEAPTGDEMAQAYQDVDKLNKEMMDAGAWVFAGGLFPPSTATVVRARDGELFTTDGPFTEGKEHIGGFWIIKTPDLDAALIWAGKATQACRQPIEVRPFQEDAG